MLNKSIPILLMFGPCHGMTLHLPMHILQSGQLYVMEDAPVRHVERDIFLNGPMPFTDKGLRHVYTRMDEFSNENMEECALFLHDEGCCERTMEDASGDFGMRSDRPNSRPRFY